MSISKREYAFVKRKTYKGKSRYLVTRMTIQCIGGGETMTSEKPKMIFLDAKEIPTKARGRTGKNWLDDFEKIPVGKAWLVPEEYASGATLREAVKKINKNAKAEVYKITQRTNKETDTIQIYVLRVK